MSATAERGLKGRAIIRRAALRCQEGRQNLLQGFADGGLHDLAVCRDRDAVGLLDRHLDSIGIDTLGLVAIAAVEQIRNAAKHEIASIESTTSWIVIAV